MMHCISKAVLQVNFFANLNFNYKKIIIIIFIKTSSSSLPRRFSYLFVNNFNKNYFKKIKKV